MVKVMANYDHFFGVEIIDFLRKKNRFLLKRPEQTIYIYLTLVHLCSYFDIYISQLNNLCKMEKLMYLTFHLPFEKITNPLNWLCEKFCLILERRVLSFKS